MSKLRLLIFSLCSLLLGQAGYSARIDFILVEENICFFDDSEPEDLYDNSTDRFEKRYLAEVFLTEVSSDLREQGLSYLAPSCKDITSKLNDLLKEFSHLNDDDYVFYKRYHPDLGVFEFLEQ